MCGEIPEGCYGQDLVVHFKNGEAAVTLSFPRRFENVVEIRMLEYDAQLNVGGHSTTHLYRLDLNDTNIQEQCVTNAPGKGFCFVLNPNYAQDSLSEHHVYNVPRIISVTQKGMLNQLMCRLFLVDSNLSVDGVNSVIPVTWFREATFFIQVIMKDPTWVPRNESLQINRPTLQFDGRGTFVHQ